MMAGTEIPSKDLMIALELYARLYIIEAVAGNVSAALMIKVIRHYINMDCGAIALIA